MDTQLYYAARRGDLAAVKRELARGASPNGLQENYHGKKELPTPLIAACGNYKASLELVQTLVEHGADVNLTINLNNRRGEKTPLFAAIKWNYLEKVAYLLEAGARVDYVSPTGVDVLNKVLYWSLEGMQLLLAHGASSHNPPLNEMSRRFQFNQVGALLRAGADPTPLQWNELHKLVILGTFEDLAELLNSVEEANLGEMLTAKDSWERTAWLLALVIGDLNKAKLLLEYQIKQLPAPQPPAEILTAALLYAAGNHQDNAQLLQWLLEQTGANPDLKNSNDTTPLIEATSFSNTECVKVLLAAGADLKLTDNNGMTVLMKAAGCGNVEIVKALLAAGADLNQTSTSNSTALMEAAGYGNAEIVKALLAAGADPNQTSDSRSTKVSSRGARRTSKSGSTALMEAAQSRNSECVKLLLAAGADPFIGDDPETAMVHAENIEIVELLVKAGMDINCEFEGFNVLEEAIRAGRTEMVKGLLELGAKLNVPGIMESALRRAARKDDLESAQILLAAGADPNQQHDGDGTVLTYTVSVEMTTLLLDNGATLWVPDIYAAEYQNDPAVLQVLLQRGINLHLNAEYKDETDSVFTEAIKNYDLSLASWLIEQGADINITEYKEVTGLMIAAEHSWVEGINFLLEKGAKVETADKNQHTALFHAATPEGFHEYEVEKKYRHRLRQSWGYVESDSTEVLELLVQKGGADINARDELGFTPLMFAAAYGRPARVRGLLALGADPLLKNNEGKTALDLAQSHEIPDQGAEIIQMLAESVR